MVSVALMKETFTAAGVVAVVAADSAQNVTVFAG